MSKCTRMALVCTVLALWIHPQQSSAQPWPDTGQSRCYSNSQVIDAPPPGEAFYGQDAQYQGVSRSYTKLGKGGVALPDDEPHVNAGGRWIMTRDNVTGLVWEVKTAGNQDDTYPWANAQDVFLAGMNEAVYGGFSDWRVPEVWELLTLVDAGRRIPAMDDRFFGDMSCYPAYWTHTPYQGDSGAAWTVDFAYGTSRAQGKDTSNLVRCVRGAPWPPPPPPPPPVLHKISASPAEDGQTYLGCPKEGRWIYRKEVTLTYEYNIPSDAPSETYSLILEYLFVRRPSGEFWWVKKLKEHPRGSSGQESITFTVEYYDVYMDCYEMGKDGQYPIYVYLTDYSGEWSIYHEPTKHNAFDDYITVLYRKLGD